MLFYRLTSYTNYDKSYTEVKIVQQVTVGPKLQVVIPKNVRKTVPDLKPGKKVRVHPLNAQSVIIEIPSNDWVDETYGMHKDIWQGIDATEYIRKLRSEWEAKSK